MRLSVPAARAGVLVINIVPTTAMSASELVDFIFIVFLSVVICLVSNT